MSQDPERVLQEHFDEWVRSLLAGKRRDETTPASHEDDLDAILDIQRTCVLIYERVGPWRLKGPWDIPYRDDADAADTLIPAAAETDVTCIGHLPNGDLVLAARARTSGKAEVWRYDHERFAVVEPLADSIASFFCMASLDQRLEKPPEHEPSPALRALEDTMDLDAWYALVDAERAAFEATEAAEVKDAFAALDGRVAFHFTFGEIKRWAPPRFTPYVSTSPLARALAARR